MDEFLINLSIRSSKIPEAICNFANWCGKTRPSIYSIEILSSVCMHGAKIFFGCLSVVVLPIVVLHTKKIPFAHKIAKIKNVVLFTKLWMKWRPLIRSEGPLEVREEDLQDWIDSFFHQYHHHPTNANALENENAWKHFHP